MSQPDLGVPADDLARMEKLVVWNNGDVSKVGDDRARLTYYVYKCDQLGLDWRQKPFAFYSKPNPNSTYQNKLANMLVLELTMPGMAQLRAVHGISLSPTVFDIRDDLVIAHATAYTPTGRSVSCSGIVTLYEDEKVWNGSKSEKTGRRVRLIGDRLQNALMTAESKAQNRVTKAIVGLGVEEANGSHPVERLMPAPVATPPISDEEVAHFTAPEEPDEAEPEDEPFPDLLVEPEEVFQAGEDETPEPETPVVDQATVTEAAPDAAFDFTDTKRAIMVNIRALSNADTAEAKTVRNRIRTQADVPLDMPEEAIPELAWREMLRISDAMVRDLSPASAVA